MVKKILERMFLMSKTLMLMRHGHAMNSLTLLGKEEVDNVARQFVSNNLVPDLIIHSPLLRAVETAQRVKNIFNDAGFAVPLTLTDWLECDMYADVTDLRGIDPSVNVVLAVSHQPNIQSLTVRFSDVAVSPINAETRVLDAGQEWATFVRGKEIAVFKVR